MTQLYMQTLDINYTCLYGDYKNNKQILDLMTRVKQNEQFTSDHPSGKGDVCSMLFVKVDEKKGFVDSFNPTIIIRSGPVVVGFVDVDTNIADNSTIIEHICATKGYGSISLAIAENVIWTPCERLKAYSEFPEKLPKDGTIYLENVITGTFYERCGYKRVENDETQMEKLFDTEYVKKLDAFLKSENIFYEDIDTFYNNMIDHKIETKTYIPKLFSEWTSHPKHV